ncbi:MAG: hypothetical protein WCC17_00245 [Candidatus Nitrosopolaris sp.]
MVSAEQLPYCNWNYVNSILPTSFDMKAARIVKLKEPLQVQELQTPKPKGTQLLIKVQSAGVCHSDAHVLEEIQR